MFRVTQTFKNLFRFSYALVFTAIGINGFVNVIAWPPYPPRAAEMILQVYLVPMALTSISVVALIIGLVFLLNFRLRVLLIALTPVFIWVFAFHLIWAPVFLSVATGLLVCHIVYIVLVSRRGLS